MLAKANLFLSSQKGTLSFAGAKRASCQTVKNLWL